MKLPKPILFYLLTFEMLQLADELEISKSAKKAVRTFEALAIDVCKSIEVGSESHGLMDTIHDELMPQFHKFINDIEI
jgi:hypothetical protein